ncbi:MAG: 23S rRNA pseudouridine1911/1915/1917 synthase [Saprospiraceae bacterium]|jgi:23S rRNA pseudouridine1911/1915/1917 synthase
MKKKLDIIFEDEHLIIVAKPQHILAIPDRHEVEKPNVLSMLRKQFGDIFTVHRIDKETSGVMVFARNEFTHKELSLQFQNREVKKVYTALVDGTLLKQTGIIEAPLLNNLASSGKVVVNKAGKACETHYEVIEQFRDYAIVEFDLKTGRTHQIRAHSLHIGHPLMTDKIYGKREEFMLSSVKRKKYSAGKNQVERALLNRSSLHASHLTFTHPHTKETVSFTAELPKDLRATVTQLRKWNAVR